MFYTWRLSDAPISLDAPCIQIPPEAPICSNTPICPQCSLVHLHVLGVSACDWGMWGALLFGHTPMCLDASQCVQHPPHIYMLSCMSVCSRVYCIHYGGNIPYVWGLGASAHLSGFWCLSVHPLDVHYASAYTFFVVHYVSSLYFHCYDYYSSSDHGVFWYVISVIGDHGSLFDGASYNVRSA